MRKNGRDAEDLMVGARRLHFAPQLERLFLEEYAGKSVGISRAALSCSTLLFMAFGFLDPYTIPSATKQVWLIRYGLVLPVLLVIIALSFLSVFRKIMQAALSVSLLAVGFGLIGMTMLSKPDELGYLLYPMGLLLVPMIGYAFVRLRFWYATIANLINALAYFTCAITFQHILATPRGAASIISQAFFIVSINVIGIATCYSLELYARRTFVANYQLEQERAGEQRKREKTEAMLLILSQAIGGVVHDLGNPLTSVQVGAQTLDLYLDNGLNSVVELKELTAIINTGAEMLNHLRISLMEQTRVLQGKPIPIDPVPTPIRSMIEAGVGFQKPQQRDGRALVLSGEDREIEVDSLKMTTVWMNLIGNALKYSDGQVRIQWREAGQSFLVAVGDEGHSGRGLSREQADQLFVAFGRLDSHLAVEGTGLGLLSVRRIVEAHGGEVFIEGWGEGERFSTAQSTFPTMLDETIRSAFVVALPLKARAWASGEVQELPARNELKV
jgi:signal transduction histidine kinase